MGAEGGVSDISHEYKKKRAVIRTQYRVEIGKIRVASDRRSWKGLFSGGACQGREYELAGHPELSAHHVLG